MNRIRNIALQTRTVHPANAEIWVLAEAEEQTAGTELRGRLTGPRNPYRSTVEVAYPLRPFPQPPELLPELARRIIIPDPCFWDPQNPFLYEGAVELWQDEQLCERRSVRHGLCNVRLGARGLFWNGELLWLRGLARHVCSEAEARTLHEHGWNAFLVPLNTLELSLLDIADRIGFVVLGHAQRPEDLDRIPQLAPHVSWLGVVLGPMIVPQVAELTESLRPAGVRSPLLIGADIIDDSTTSLPGVCSFVAGDPTALAASADQSRQRLLFLTEESDLSSTGLESQPGVIGCIFVRIQQQPRV